MTGDDHAVAPGIIPTGTSASPRTEERLAAARERWSGPIRAALDLMAADAPDRMDGPQCCVRNALGDPTCQRTDTVEYVTSPDARGISFAHMYVCPEHAPVSARWAWRPRGEWG